MALGDKPAPFGITPELRDTVYHLKWHDLFANQNASKLTALQVAINRHRRAWDTWTETKVMVKTTRDGWQAAFDTFRGALEEYRRQEQELTDEQGKAFSAGDMDAAKAAFDSLQEVRTKIRDLEAPSSGKTVSAEEAAKQQAQKAWRQAQVAEAAARAEQISSLAILLTLGETLDNAATEEYDRVVRSAPKLPLPITLEDATAVDSPFAIAAVEDDDDQTPADPVQSTGTNPTDETPGSPSEKAASSGRKPKSS